MKVQYFPNAKRLTYGALSFAPTYYYYQKSKTARIPFSKMGLRAVHYVI